MAKVKQTSRSVSPSPKKPIKSPQDSSPGSAKKASRKSKASIADVELWTPKQYSQFEFALRTWIGPALLVLVCPLFVNLAALAMVKTDGSIYDVLFHYKPLRETVVEAFPPPNTRVVKAVALFVAFQFFLLRTIPGKKYYGPVSPAGERPLHTKNGGPAFAVTFVTFFALVHLDLLDPCIIFDELLPLMTCLNLSALVLSVLLFIKGLYFPSTRDHGSDNPWLFRFYEGEELYPSLLGVDLKNFVICRLGMMGWAVFIVSLSAASYREHNNSFTNQLLASACLNFFYVVKFFFLYEEGYMSAGDIAVDRYVFARPVPV
jgi:7-dehydrocholesterol reductase